MSKAKIFYFTLQDEQTKEEKLEWFEQTRFEQIPFDHITPDQKANWINLTDNDFDSFLPLIDKEVKAGRSQEAVFQLFSTGVQTKKDEWLYDFSNSDLINKVIFLIDEYHRQLSGEDKLEPKIKWDRELRKSLSNNIQIKFNQDSVVKSMYRPYSQRYLYFDLNLIAITFQIPKIFPLNNYYNFAIWIKTGTEMPFYCVAISSIPDTMSMGGAQCLPFYRYDENGKRIDNITDWALEKFRNHYHDELSQPRGLSPLFDRRGEGSNLWFVTFVTHNSRISERMVTYGVTVGEPLIFSAEDQIFIAETISEAAKRYGIAIALFNVLPDHVHMVVSAQNEKDLNEHIRKIKGFSSHKFQRSRNWDKGQHVWAQKFNRQLIEEENALTEILEYVWNNHIKHTERWGEELISTWETGLPNKGLKPLVEIVRGGCTGIETILNSDAGTRGLSPLPDCGRDITKLDIFHYTYAVLHHPAYRTKYELNLKREFPRLPFYADFHQWAAWGKALMDLHLNYEAIEPYGLTRHDIASKENPKVKLKADKTHGTITLDENTQLSGVPATAWDYKLGNRSALEWILDQYKEKKPKDPTIRELFNTYKFADYKEHVIDLLQRVCTVSVRTMEIIQQMPDTVEHQGGTS